MKTILLLACVVIFLTDVYSQETWVKRADFGGGLRTGATGFSIGAKGYLATGKRFFIGSGQLKDFWEFDPSTNTWTPMPDFAGGAREGAVGFSIGGKGYIGLGLSQDSGYFKSLWEYDPVASTWIPKATLPATGRAYATVIVINDKAYIAFGQSSGIGLVTDFWEYDPALDRWTAKKPFPGDPRVRATGFAIGAKGYVGTGFNGNFNNPVIKKDFWEYDPVANDWTQKADFGGGFRHSAAGFVIDGKGYMTMGASAVTTNAYDIWKYDPTTNTWTRQMDFPYTNSPLRCGAVAFTMGNKGYLGTGYFLSSNLPTNGDFWEYNPCNAEANAGDPSVFGDNVWNVYAWNSGGTVITSETWGASYRGYYVDSSVSFDSRNMWPVYNSPSYAPGYIGCPVNSGNNSWSAKRKGFECGYYAININHHDGGAQLFIDDVKVWEDSNCCNPAYNVWEGTLGADSKIEFRVTHGAYFSSGSITLFKTVPVITAGGATGFCAGESVTLTSSYSSGNQWYKDGLALEGDTGQTYVATQPGAYTTRVVITGCPSLSLPVNVSVTTPPGDPSVFGDNVWNVYAWNDGNGTLTASAWQNNYRGYYTDNSIYLYTKWYYFYGAPSDVGGYQGCGVRVDNHSWSAKRKGFPCGQYKISVQDHDDAAQLFINGVKIWEHDGCCDPHDSLWQGYLDADSKIEFRGTEGVGGSDGYLDILQVKPGITRSSGVVCSGAPVTLTASPGPDYVWSTGEHTQSISVTQPGTYSVSQTDNCGNPVLSNPVTIISLAAPGTIPSDTVDLNLGTGTIKAIGPSGNQYNYRWYRTGETNPVATGAILTPMKEGDYYATVSRENCTSPPSKTVHLIDPVPFGDNIWYVHYFPDYNGDAGDPNYNYYGYYSDTSLSFDTRSRWGADSTPALASGYQGLAYDWEWDNFKFLVKRKGFPCGHYKINIPWHDDHMELWINDVKVFAHYDCCDSHPDVWEGDLGPNSTITLKVVEEYGDAIGAIEFELMSDIAKPAITPVGPVNICSLDSVTFASSATNGNVWSTGDTTQSITVHTTGSYSVAISSEGCTAQSDPVDVTVTPAQTYYADADGDGFGNPAISTLSCTQPPGYVANNTDCNDNKASIFPKTWYRDVDADGYGDMSNSVTACTRPAGYVVNQNDCNDSDNTIYPKAPELCDGKDNNCNGTIDEKCPTVTVSIDDVSMNEGNKGKTNMTFSISLSAAATKKVTVQFATQDGGAIAGTDYEAKSGTVTFNAGVIKQTINISVIGDKIVEPNETFNVNLSNPVNATITKATGTGTIINDDGTTIASVTSSAKTAGIRSVKISPSPANSILKIELSGYMGNVTLQLVSMQGKTLLQKKMETIASFAKEQINVSGFASGTYLLAVIDEKGNMKTEKVIISH